MCGRSRSSVPGVTVAERIEVADAPARDRYELSIDGEVVGFTAYRARPFVKAFIERHREFETLVPETYREQFGL